MAGLLRRQVAVVEVEVANQGAVAKRGKVGRGAAAADQRAARRAAEVVHMLADHPGHVGAERPDGTAQRVEQADPDRLAGLPG
jgi:hypothetical protein